MSKSTFREAGKTWGRGLRRAYLMDWSTAVEAAAAVAVAVVVGPAWYSRNVSNVLTNLSIVAIIN